jgi:hypothetical protein
MQTVSGGKIPTCTECTAGVRDGIHQKAPATCTGTVARATKLFKAANFPISRTLAVRRELLHGLSEQNAWAATSYAAARRAAAATESGLPFLHDEKRISVVWAMSGKALLSACESDAVSPAFRPRSSSILCTMAVDCRPRRGRALTPPAQTLRTPQCTPPVTARPGPAHAAAPAAACARPAPHSPAGGGHRGARGWWFSAGFSAKSACRSTTPSHPHSARAAAARTPMPTTRRTVRCRAGAWSGGVRGPGSGSHGWRALGCAQCLRRRGEGTAASRPAVYRHCAGFCLVFCRVFCRVLCLIADLLPSEIEK